MNFKSRFLLKLLLIFLYRYAVVKAALFVFLINDEEFFQDCKNEPNYLGVASLFDVSDFKLEVLDDIVHAQGSFTMMWDVNPDDRVDLRAELYKFDRGSWVPTVFTYIANDVCSKLFDKSSIFYEVWTQYVDVGDWKCITNKGHTYHHEPFDVELKRNIVGSDVSGLHKIVIKLDAYNQQNQKQPNSICLEVVGDIIRK